MADAHAPTVAWFHCFSGVAGDMALGALIDAGADIAEVRNLLELLPLGGWQLAAEVVTRGGMSATKVHVLTEETTVVRTFGHITGLITEARLPDRVRDRALTIFGALAEAEGRVHQRPPEQVHFHEVGGLDAIVDVVGSCAALEQLGVDEVWCSPVVNGLGTIRSAHGLLPNPPPAVVELLRGAPTLSIDVPSELTTPTGAAIMSALAVGWGPMPAMVVRASGFGAGSRELDNRPNVTQVVLGERAGSVTTGQRLLELSTNVDDATGEQIADTVAALLDAGAYDAWVTPVVMKKGRPGHVVSALAEPVLGDELVAVLRRETGSWGVRGREVTRWPVPRRDEEVEVDGVPVRVKVGPGRVKIEHDDAARAAELSGRPLREVVSLAEEAWRRRGDGHSGDEPAS